MLTSFTLPGMVDTPMTGVLLFRSRVGMAVVGMAIGMGQSMREPRGVLRRQIEQQEPKWPQCTPIFLVYM